MTSKVKITFLGTSGAIPTVKRNHTGILLSYKNENILVDCGEGTQRQFRKAELNPCKITKLLITHWHGDHVLGIPGLLQTLALSDYKKTLLIYGPKGTKKFLSGMLKTFVFVKKYKIKVKEISKPGKFFENDDFYLGAEKMTHGTFCNAYNFVVKGQRRIDKAELKKSKLASGPLLKKLKHGKDITYKGKKYTSNRMTYTEGEKKISFGLDTSENKKIVPFAKDSDLLILESNYGSELSSKAKEHKHLTPKQAATIAKKAKSKRLILTHISQRYDNKLKNLSNEAKKVFKKTSLAEDLDVVEVR